MKLDNDLGFLQQPVSWTGSWDDALVLPVKLFTSARGAGVVDVVEDPEGASQRALGITHASA